MEENWARKEHDKCHYLRQSAESKKHPLHFSTILLEKSALLISNLIFLCPFLINFFRQMV